ncbi:MAG TPA: hypothetical protein VNQ90_01585 [Chthoniobacteraceae bacterium]|nr:hypothetical protein [Chthoniobacteraceae bacterium]
MIALLSPFRTHQAADRPSSAGIAFSLIFCPLLLSSFLFPFKLLMFRQESTFLFL